MIHVRNYGKKVRKARKVNGVLILILFLSFFVLSFCSKKEDKTTELDRSKKEEIKPPLLIEPEKETSALDFTLLDLEGKELNLKDYRGKVLLLNFWATWCAPCTKEMPSMVELKKILEDEPFEILAVSLDRNRSKVEEFAEKFQLNFPVLLDPEGFTADMYKVYSIPASHLIDKKGNLVGTIMGGRDWVGEEYLGFVQSLLDSSS